MNGQNSFSKQHGLLEQQQKGFFAVRVRTIAGNLTSVQMHHLADLATKYGNGQVHITTRQSVEMHWVQESQLESVFREMHDLGLLLAVRGPRILTTIGCPGKALCRQGICDTTALAAQLDALMVGREQPGKTKIAVSGCANCCAKPQINDIGLHGVIVPAVVDGCDGVSGGEKPGYAIYVGGKIGKKSMLGNKVFTVIPEQEAVSYIEAILGAYNQLALKGERIGDVVNRIGLAGFRQQVLNPEAG